MKNNQSLGKITAGLIFLFSLSVAGLAVLSCGGGEDTQASGGIGGTGVTMGMVTDYGSIFVNGVEIHTGSADVFVENEFNGTGDQAVLDHLPIGQVVVVHGTLADDTGIADTIEAYHRVRGPLQSVTSIDGATAMLIVLGQTVYVDHLTHWIGVSLDTLAIDQLLQITGLVDDRGAIYAGHVALIAPQAMPDAQVALKGRVQSLNETQNTFQINALVVDYSLAQSILDNLSNDQEVAVHGLLEGETLTAQTVTLFDSETFDSVENFSLEGFVTDIKGFHQWRIGTYNIRPNQNALLERMVSEDLTDGIRIQVRGRLQNRTLHAIKVAMTSRVRLESQITAMDVANGRLTLEGMAPLMIRTNDLTRIHGRVGSSAELQVGDQVRIHAHALNAGTVVAEKIFVIQAPGRMDGLHLEGPVTRISLPELDILGVTVATTADLDFYDSNGRQITRLEFFNALTVDALVRVTGTWALGQTVYESATILQ